LFKYFRENIGRPKKEAFCFKASTDKKLKMKNLSFAKFFEDFTNFLTSKHYCTSLMWDLANKVPFVKEFGGCLVQPCHAFFKPFWFLSL